MAVAVALGVALAVVLAARPWDPRMGAKRAARSLDVRVHTGARYSCKAEENDGTIVGMHDVDYFCQPDVRHRLATGYWLGTNSSRITELQPSG